ncbi:homogentisate 1,2-dioxygenase [Marivirga atlantica]|jgi:homogentisate 1,2-dioxygenase|uniref:Homogentisate 1,2-dioxygenase n=1 Tax=Marivirga atlantica TaxID=1548457 RepID=A0A937A934_9BACT|nr:homogentisate 1,2-dioxygenase [Marivirga atlantica]MBL0766072.1 homogentisate 1,2-dioxygenase [Marivirga atlantica]
MAYYVKMGNIPPKRHTQFRQPDGSLYAEELVSSLGFSGVYSNLYHINPPTEVKEIKKSVPYSQKVDKDFPLQQIHLNTSKIKETGGDFLESRKYLLMNDDVAMALSMPSRKSMDYYYKNAEADEVLYIHDGKGTLYSQFGKLEIKKGDYVVIPRTTIYKIEWDSAEIRYLLIESSSPVETVSRYRNKLGQLEEHSPYCERDIHPPQELYTEESKGDYHVKIKKGGYIHNYVYDHSPFDIVGWDGFLYPYTFSIYDFEPVTGRIHLPPPVHQTFQAHGFVICSFVPRLFDYHPLSIPAPYNHSNIDSDEVLYYAEGNFMSRKGIDRGSFTLHPGGLPHGPHPGTVEKSIGAKETKEYAVMVDTFKPLYVTEDAKEFLDPNYPMSWTEK